MTAPAVILSRPQLGENIGSAARAMKNFGLTDLRLIAPQCEWPNDRAMILASGAGDIIESARVFATAAEALSDIRILFATTARGRDVLREILTPEAAAQRLRTAEAEGLKTAILFGSERAGLDNDEISLADAAITIPTSKFPSLNLGQAVLLLGYEWLKSADATPASRTRKTVAVPSPRADLIGLFEHLERELDAAKFFYPPEKKEAMVRNIRAMILRSQLNDQETRTIRGMIVALAKNKWRGSPDEWADVKAVLYLGLVMVALAAIGFAMLPLWRAKSIGGRGVLAGAIALFLLGVGGGTYWMLGQPYLAWRAAQGVETRDVNGLIALLVKRARVAPNDLQAWVYLGRGYMGAGDAGDAAKAYARAVTLANASGHPDSGLDTLYGEALVAQANGTVGDEAEAAFRAALIRNPKEQAARFFLGQALATRGDKASALDLWNGLLAETPANSPLHQTLVDRIALLTAQGGGAAPDPKAMVAGLAARLKDNPDDAAGWQRLIRAYSVLNQRADAQDALATARKTFAGKADVLATLDAEAKDLKLN